MVAVVVKGQCPPELPSRLGKSNSESVCTREKDIHTDKLAAQHRNVPHLRHHTETESILLNLRMWKYSTKLANHLYNKLSSGQELS